MDSSQRRSRRLLATGLALAALGAGPAAEPLGERIEGDLTAIQNLIKNARIKLENGISGVAGGAKPAAAPTPARLCCPANLEKIRERAADLQSGFDELARCYDAAGESGGRASVEFAGRDLAALLESVGRFETAPQAQVDGALGLVMRDFLRLRETSDALPECAAAPAKKGGTKDGKKKKKERQ